MQKKTPVIIEKGHSTCSDGGPCKCKASAGKNHVCACGHRHADKQ